MEWLFRYSLQACVEQPWAWGEGADGLLHGCSTALLPHLVLKLRRMTEQRVVANRFNTNQRPKGLESPSQVWNHSHAHKFAGLPIICLFIA